MNLAQKTTVHVDNKKSSNLHISQETLKLLTDISADLKRYASFIWASWRENLLLVCPTKRVSNQSPQLQRQARKLKFHL